MHRNFIFLNTLADISPNTFEELKSISEFKKIPEGTQLVRQNEIPKKVYMLVSGIIRCYLSTENGKEFNKSFYLPTTFVGSLTALLKDRPSYFVFETLTDCKLYEVDYKKLMKLCEETESLSRLYNKILEHLYIKYEKRLVELISLDAKERYLALQDQIPNVDELIPQYHIASYLGITPVQLSRIRKNLGTY
jgi:CRP-like cAMP-binding protein